LRFSPPPPPLVAVVESEAAWTELGHGWVTTVATVVVIIGLVALAAGSYLRARWPAMFEAAVRSAFAKVDSDGSGNVDREELYTGVLWLYLTCNDYGLRCSAPEKALVLEIMSIIDVDGSGTLDYKEFKQVLIVFSEQIFARAGMQLIFTILCPPTAGLICEIMEKVWSTLVPAALIPPRLVVASQYVPDAAPVVTVTTILTLLLPWALACVDALSSKASESRRRELQSRLGSCRNASKAD